MYHKSYKTIEEDVDRFIEIGVSLPLGMTKESLIESNQSVAENLLLNKAVYHTSCRDTIRNKELQIIFDRQTKEKRKLEQDNKKDNSFSPTKKTRSSFSSSFDGSIRQCVSCLRYESKDEEPILKCQTTNEKLKEMAFTARNWPVYARLNIAFDNTASDISYHKSCYTSLFNESCRAKKETENGKIEPGLPYDPLVIAELIAFVQFNRSAVKLNDLKRLYQERLKEKNSKWINVDLNATRFKEHLLQKLGDEWQSFKYSKYVILSPISNIGEILNEHLKKDLSEDECKKIVEVGMLIRNHILQVQPDFNGYFSEDCLLSQVPSPLFTLVQVLLEGVTFIDRKNLSDMNARTKVALGLSQLIISNSVKRGRENTENLQQVQKRETPLPLYVGLKLDSNGRQKKIIKQCHRYGLSVSYDRVKKIRKKLAKAVSKRFEEDKVVVPTNCCKGVFTTGTTDNIDVSGRNEMHGTSITMIGHVTNDNPGEKRPKLDLKVEDEVPLILPEEYINVPFIEDCGDEFRLKSIPEGKGRSSACKNISTEENSWLCHVRNSRKKDENNKWQLPATPVTFSGYFSKKQNIENVNPPCIIGTFPVFTEEKADSLSMQKHAMIVVKKATEFLNPGQTPIIEGDCPLYARQKACQWLCPEEVGEDKMVCMIGFLHLEMCLQEVGGKILGGSGWERMFSLSKIHTPGVAASLLGGHKVKKTRQAYLVTLAWLDILKYQTYEQHCQGIGPHESIEMWERKLLTISPTAHFWGKTVREFLLRVCKFVRSQRLGKWHECLSTIDSVCPYFFALGHTNYARWVPVFIRDMAQLSVKHPDVYKEFLNKHFVVQCSHKKFSLMGLDQSQEHSIKFLKEDSGPTGLYGYEKTEERLVIELSKAEVLRIIEDFEYNCFRDDSHSNNEHPEGSITEQNRFLDQVQCLIDLVDQDLIVNPYSETENKLVTLDSGEYIDPEIEKCLKNLTTIGGKLHSEYVKERVEICSKPISDIISKPKVYTFTNPPPIKLKSNSKLGSLKASFTMVTQMFVSLQARPDSDMSEFFMYENCKFPPSLSDNGKLRQGTKSHILDCLPGIPGKGKNPDAKSASVVVLDMPAVIHMVKPQKCHLFSEYIPMHLLPFLNAQLNDSSTRIDAVWDRYPEESLKSQTRTKRLGTVKERRIRPSDNVPIPTGKEWQSYLKVSENKEDFFKYLANGLVTATLSSTYSLLSTKGEVVISNKTVDMSRISMSDHEEADSRMILHLFDAAFEGHEKGYLRTVDTDVLVILIYHFKKLNQIGLKELWVGFGKGKSYKDIPIHEVSHQLGDDYCQALPFFHAFTGCDLTSSMSGVGKKTAWAALKFYPEVIHTMIELTKNPTALDEDKLHMERLERFTVMMYNKNCSKYTVNEARQSMFTHDLKTLENIPPTRASLYQHVKRTLLVAAYIWHFAFRKTLDIPSPNLLGWIWNERLHQYVPHWTDLDDASEACSLLIHCGCKKSCTGNCKCLKAEKDVHHYASARLDVQGVNSIDC